MNYPEKTPEMGEFSVNENNESYNSGYRLIYKSTIKHGYVGFEKPYQRSEAWLWLILNAWGNQNKKGEIAIENKVFILDYGEMVYSLRFLASAWGWSEKRARTFLQNLEKLSMITRKVTQQMTQITICNFGFYQNRGHSKGQIEGEPRANRGRTEGTKKNTISLKQYANAEGEFHKLQNWIWDTLPHVSKMEKQLSFAEAERLVSDFDKKLIQEVLEAMENYKGVEKKNTSVNLTLRNWIKRRQENSNGKYQEEPKREEIKYFK